MPAPRPLRRRQLIPAVLLAGAAALTGCGDDADNPAQDDQAEVVGGNPQPDEQVTTSVSVNSLQLAYPEDGLVEAGSDVQLYAALANNGTSDDQLLDVTGSGFEDARLVAPDGSEGAIPVPSNNTAYLEPEGPPSVTLLGVAEDLRSSQSVEVTFVFEDAGEVTMEAMVAADPPGEGEFDTPQDPTTDN
ncbi:copper chaperone PCu(A)C [Geodermatophilus marinus]|uniref:copper chaperone PCu(A)C n=1 Tax=Geodermatophilus sp. LHW52908 TaxID=2303986 RepID=UPI000E3DF76E|nr:copper chaperone PCu(A)C [Geodermatophilus sp. LHW52908]RFU21431.1 copper chaperone PCu(A)C [Geodermatophilus sp. LHW52908]